MPEISSREAIEASVRRMRLAAPDEAITLAPLTGGVSSDIYKVDLSQGSVCVKRALPRLKVAAEWLASPERNRYEVAYLRTVAAIDPAIVPTVLAEDREGLAFAMPYLDPASNPLWKQQLRDGQIDAKFARAVGTALAKIHAATADRADLAALFATDENFHAIRLEPYLLAAGLAHPELATALGSLASRTAATRRVLVHGDVSPKNILVGPTGPILLDAECAWFGDPAFDLAFCLNHLLLKCVWRPASSERLLDCFQNLQDAYLMRVTWEPRKTLETRTASLLPALMLARIDGKSPVEYLTLAHNQNLVRQFARPRLLRPPSLLANLVFDWRHWLKQHPPEREPG